MNQLQIRCIGLAAELPLNAPQAPAQHENRTILMPSSRISPTELTGEKFRVASLRTVGEVFTVAGQNPKHMAGL